MEETFWKEELKWMHEQFHALLERRGKDIGKEGNLYRQEMEEIKILREKMKMRLLHDSEEGKSEVKSASIRKKNEHEQVGNESEDDETLTSSRIFTEMKRNMIKSLEEEIADRLKRCITEESAVDKISADSHTQDESKRSTSMFPIFHHPSRPDSREKVEKEEGLPQEFKSIRAQWHKDIKLYSHRLRKSLEKGVYELQRVRDRSSYRNSFFEEFASVAVEHLRWMQNQLHEHLEGKIQCTLISMKGDGVLSGEWKEWNEKFKLLHIQFEVLLKLRKGTQEELRIEMQTIMHEMRMKVKELHECKDANTEVQSVREANSKENYETKTELETELEVLKKNKIQSEQRDDEREDNKTISHSSVSKEIEAIEKEFAAKTEVKSASTENEAYSESQQNETNSSARESTETKRERIEKLKEETARLQKKSNKEKCGTKTEMKSASTENEGDNESEEYETTNTPIRGSTDRKQKRIEELKEGMARSLKQPKEKVKKIGPAGGSLELFGCHVFFPEGALDEKINIKIAVDTNPDLYPKNLSLITPILECSPSMKFQKPVTITLSTCCLAEFGTTADATIVQKKRGMSDWEILGEATLGSELKIQFQVWHFCRFIACMPVITKPTSWQLWNDVYASARDMNIISVFCLNTKARMDIKNELEEQNYKQALRARQKVTVQLGDKIYVEIACENSAQCLEVQSGDLSTMEVTEQFVKNDMHDINFAVHSGHIQRLARFKKMIYKIVKTGPAGESHELKKPLFIQEIEMGRQPDDEEPMDQTD